MILEQIINSIASAIISGSVAILMVDIYASETSPIYRYPLFKTIHIRAALALVSSGAMLNVLIGSVPPWSEVVLNVGLALFFSWLLLFYNRYFKIERPRITRKRKGAKAPE